MAAVLGGQGKMSFYPLGRIHPHGSRGKSVFQRSAEEARQRSSGSRLGIFVAGGIVLLGVFIVTAGLVADRNLTSGGVGVVVVGLLVLNKELQDYQPCTDRAKLVNQVEPANWPACDQEFLHELQTMETAMKRAASNNDWTELLRLGMTFFHLEGSRWGPFLDANHPKKPAESLLAEKPPPIVAASMRRCSQLFLTAHRLATSAQKQESLRSDLSYDPESGRIEARPISQPSE